GEEPQAKPAPTASVPAQTEKQERPAKPKKAPREAGEKAEGSSERPPRGEKKPRSDKPKADKPRRERPAKAAAPVDNWKLEDFVVEPQEGKTRFHDFNLDP